MTALDRVALDALVAKDPRQMATTIGRMAQPADEGDQLATFLADLARLLEHEGSAVAALLAPEPPEAEDALAATPALNLTEWTATTAAALANALERGATTFPRVRAAAVRGGTAALDAIGAEMLDVGLHAAASAAFAEILSGSGRPRDVLRLVTYFAIAPDPVPAARALGACAAAELPRVLGAWLDAMLPQDGEDAEESSAARVSSVHRVAQAVPAALQRRASLALAPRRATHQPIAAGTSARAWPREAPSGPASGGVPRRPRQGTSRRRPARYARRSPGGARAPGERAARCPRPDGAGQSWARSR